MTAGKISQLLGVLRRVRTHLTLGTATMPYNSLVVPLFDYYDVVIGNLNKTNLRRLQNLKWFTIEQTQKLHTSVMVYKVMNSLAPNYLCKYFTEQLSERSITGGITRGPFRNP